MRVAIIGSGYVGLIAAACFADMGHKVISVDNDSEKVSGLLHGEIPIYEQFLPELLARNSGQRLTFTTDLRQAVRNSSVIFIAVGTPAAETGEADLSFVESVSQEIAHAIDEYKIVVEKSTVPVYTCEWIRRIISLNAVSAEFDVASNPEFMREGTAVTDFLYPDRIVIGADTERCSAVLRELYAPLLDGSYYRQEHAIPKPDSSRVAPPLVLTTAKSAELIKHACNAFLATKISFINAVAHICELVEADIDQVREGIGSDSRIGPGFLRPGIGYGGSCFPKDLAAFQSIARDSGYDFRLLAEVARVNQEQRQRFLRKIRKALWTLKGKRLGVLGLAFKGGTDDIRESPAIAIIEALLKEGSEVVAYDPAATDRAREILRHGRISFVANVAETAREADALLILTDWEEFGALDLVALRPLMRYPTIIDGRNLYTPEFMAERGFTYYSVGRHVAKVHQPLAAQKQKA